MKWPLIDKSSMYQIGGQPGHRSEELVFILKSVIAKYRMEGKQVIIQSSDLEKFFDKEMLEDAMLTCIKRGANIKACRLWYNLNKNTKIRVRTGAGMTEYTEAGGIVGQGTIAGALVSQGVIDEGISANFAPGGPDELNYGLVPMAPLIFMDDVIHGAETINDARRANVRMDRTVKQLNLNLNKDKTVCCVIGSYKQREKVKAELILNPLMCGDLETVMKDKFKWLGEIISTKGLADSVGETILSREGKIRGACLEISQIINDWRARVCGGMQTALVLWESCCIPSLLSGAGTWTDITTEHVKRLNKLQCWYLKLILRTGPGAPSISLLWDTSILEMSLRVWKLKILLVLHLRNLDETTLARKVYEEQKLMQWPGLVKETSNICKELYIEDCNYTTVQKGKYCQILQDALHKKNEEKLRGLAKGKCERISGETYGRKEYMDRKNIFDVRNHYRTRFGLLSFAGNYKNDKRFAKYNWLCRCQQAREDEYHLVSGKCKVFGDLTEIYSDLTSDEGLVQFFTAVLARRDQLDKFL